MGGARTGGDERERRLQGLPDGANFFGTPLRHSQTFLSFHSRNVTKRLFFGFLGQVKLVYHGKDTNPTTIDLPVS